MNGRKRDALKYLNCCIRTMCLVAYFCSSPRVRGVEFVFCRKAVNHANSTSHQS
jgi:hypothetical protein